MTALHDLKPGALVDGFTLGRRVHAGAMGSLFRVTHPAHAQPLVMKLPRVGPNEPRESLVAFETEASIAPTLSGPHVPRVVAVGDLAATPYLVSEWVDGQSLEERLGQGKLPAADVARIGAALADALHSVHQQGVIHLDVKPDNVILRPDGVAVLIDFGFAHAAGKPDLLAEETRSRVGSAPYVSPEQLLGKRDDRRSDLFALGVILYELATGVLPFGEPDSDVRNRFWLEPLPPVRLEPALPPWLQEIVLRSLEIRPERRYQSAAHLAFDLRHPEQVPLTARATKRDRPGTVSLIQRFLRVRAELGDRLRTPRPLHAATPIVLVAVDTTHPADARHPAIRDAVSQFLALSREFRLIALAVFQPPETSLEHMLRLRRWVASLELSSDRLSLHAIESDAVADVIVELARHNNVDLIVLGAPAAGVRAWSRSVASEVTARVSCSVHVVRVPPRDPPP